MTLIKRFFRKPRKRRIGLLGNKSGASAVEFALVAPVFLAMMISTFEVGWFFFVNSVVDAATIDVSRLVRTGQAQNGGYSGDPDAFFADHVCPKLSNLADCDTRLTVEVQSYPDFGTLANDNSAPTCRDAPPEDIQSMPYNMGADNTIQRVRICLMYDTLNPTIGINLADKEDGTRKIVVSYVFRNEPYSKNQQHQTP